MGIQIQTMTDGRKRCTFSPSVHNHSRSFAGIQLIHNTANAASHGDAEDGLVFIREMMEMMKNTDGPSSAQSNYHVPLSLIPLIDPSVTKPMSFGVGPAQFGKQLHGMPGVSERPSTIIEQQSFSR